MRDANCYAFPPDVTHAKRCFSKQGKIVPVAKGTGAVKTCSGCEEERENDEYRVRDAIFPLNGCIKKGSAALLPPALLDSLYIGFI